jgi:hypothetical protein
LTTSPSSEATSCFFSFIIWSSAEALACLAEDRVRIVWTNVNDEKTYEKWMRLTKGFKVQKKGVVGGGRGGG